AQTFVNALGILAGFVAVALLMVVIDRWRGRSTVEPL
ncbi:MAG: Pr6Pr family membrane protein, partial [Pseudomonas helleri]